MHCRTDGFRRGSLPETNMLPRMKILFTAALAMTLVGMFWGCDRVTGKHDENQIPVVSFVNIPLDSSRFAYAPVVRWTGYDPDGLVTEFQYFDDTTLAAQAAYYATNQNINALTEYATRVPDSLWTRTFATQDTVYLRRGEQDSVTQHTFLLRCVDNLGAFSLVKARHFSRTNRPPNTPKVKWLLDSQQDQVREYLPRYDIPDTLFWNDSLMLTYPGIAFNWTGSDSDGTSLNPIPLTFSWTLVNVTTGDTIPYSAVDSSGTIIRNGNWSPWSNDKQTVFYANYVRRLNPSQQVDGRYQFLVRVRDDGLTQADTMAMATFTAISPIFDRQMLIVDWAKHPTSDEYSYGLDNDARIDSFYQANIPPAFALAEQIRQFYYNTPGPNYIPEIPMDTAWYMDKNVTSPGRVPYDYIRHFKYIWVIGDNPPYHPPANDQIIWGRVKVMQDYMDVGGQMIIAGRRIFHGYFNLGQPHMTLSANIRSRVQYFLRSHFNITQVHPGLPNGPADFIGAATTDRFLPQLVRDSVLVHNLRFRTGRVWNLPEIDYLGRSAGTTGYDITYSPYTYQSSTQNDSLTAFNVDCSVDSALSTARVANLIAPDDRLLDVTRVYNVTKQVAGEFIRTEVDAQGRWRILVSTPETAGEWSTADVLEVDYKFLHVAETHDQPVAVINNKIESLFNYDPVTGRWDYVLYSRYRSAVLCVPLSFMDMTPVDTYYLPGITVPAPVSLMAQMILTFNTPRTVAIASGGTR
jgi:hypothetical protein